MTNYIKITNYAAKDALLSGNAAKIVRGTELGADYDAVAVAVATKANTADTLAVFAATTSAQLAGVLTDETGTGSLVFATSPALSFAAGTALLPTITQTGNTNTGMWFPAADTIAFSEGGVEAMRINSSGSLLLGTVSGGLYSATQHISSPNCLDITNTASSAVGTGIAIRRTDGAGGEAMRFISNTTVVGFINTTSSATSYLTSSDYRLKENVAPMTGALEKVSALKPRTYNWKADGSDGQGFIAHELQDVIPDCVTGAKDAVDAEGKPKYQGIDTSFLVATLTAAIQEQQALITQLQVDVAALQA